MKESWATETILQEASLGTELPASPASQYNHRTAAELPESPAVDVKRILEQEDKPTEGKTMDSDIKENRKEVRCLESENCGQKIPDEIEEGNKKREWCSRGIAVCMAPSSPVSPSISSVPCRESDGNQPMYIPDNMVECLDDQEQIVPQSDTSCVITRPTPSDRQMPSVSCRIMKMGLKDVLDEPDSLLDTGEKSIPSVSSPSNSTSLSASSSTSSFLTSSYSSNRSIMSSNLSPFQSNKTPPLWHRQSQPDHKIFGPLARPTTTTVHASSPAKQRPLSSSSASPRNTIRERSGSPPIITHKKFDYQMSMKLTLQNPDAPLDLCKRSPRPRTVSAPVEEESTTVSAPVKEESTTTSSPMDLTTKIPIPSPVKAQMQFPRPVNGMQFPRPVNSKIETVTQPHFVFGAKPELDHYSAAAACRISNFFTPGSSSSSPSSSEHSSSSALSSVEQRSDPENSGVSDLKPLPEMLSRMDGNDFGMLPSFRFPDGVTHPISPLQYIDPARLSELYAQQFASKIEGGIYKNPCGYTTAVCAEQPTSPLSPTKRCGGPKPDKLFICQECHAVFKHRHHVVRHMRAHSGERPFRCEECGATFARKCILTNHKRTHTGEKPYICTECGDTFSRKHHLVIHRRTHTGEKPYICAQCGAAFARSHHLNRHRKTHATQDDPPPQHTGMGPNVRYFTPHGLPGGLFQQRIRGFAPTMLSPTLMTPLPVGTPTETLPPISPHPSPLTIGTPHNIMYRHTDQEHMDQTFPPKIPHPSPNPVDTDKEVTRIHIDQENMDQHSPPKNQHPVNTPHGTGDKLTEHMDQTFPSKSSHTNPFPYEAKAHRPTDQEQMDLTLPPIRNHPTPLVVDTAISNRVQED